MSLPDLLRRLTMAARYRDRSGVGILTERLRTYPDWSAATDTHVAGLPEDDASFVRSIIAYGVGGPDDFAGGSGDVVQMRPSSGRGDPLADVTRDATSGKLRPADLEEWGCVMTAAGAGDNPSHQWSCQGVAPAIADQIGLVDLTENGLVTYNNALAGWTTLSINLPNGSASTGWTNGTIVNLATESVLILGYVTQLATPAADREIMGAGAGTDHRYISLTAANKIKANGLAGATATSTASAPSGVFPLVLQVDRAASAYRVYFPDEIVSPVYTAPAAGGTVTAFGDAGTGGCAPVGFNHLTMWRGAAAEKSTAQVRAMLQSLGWVVVW